MESLQPSPPFQRNDELSCYWSWYPAQGPCHSLGEGGTPPATGLTLLEMPRAVIAAWGWSYLLCPAFSPVHNSSFPAFQPDWSLTASPGVSVFQVGLESGKIWDYFVKFSVFPHSLQELLAEIWVSELLRLGELCTLTIKQLSCFTLQAPMIMDFALCAKTNFFCPSISVCFFSVKA